MSLRFQQTRGSGAVTLVTQRATSFYEETGDWTVVNGATYTVLTTDRKLWIAVNPCTITFPLSASMSNRAILIKDGAGTAFTNNIHTAYTGGELCDGSSDRKITTDRGWLYIVKNPTSTGYTIVG